MPGSVRSLKGIAFPFSVGKRSFPRGNFGAQVIVDSVRSLLLTGVGEVPMSPGLGTRIHSYIFDNLTPLTKARVAQEVRTIVELGEPRMQVLSVDTSQTGDDVGGYGIVVTIEYEMAGESGTLVVTA